MKDLELLIWLNAEVWQTQGWNSDADSQMQSIKNKKQILYNFTSFFLLYIIFEMIDL